MPLVAFVQPKEEWIGLVGGVEEGNKPNAAITPCGCSQGRSPPISTLPTIMTLRAPGDRFSVHERTRWSADPDRLGDAKRAARSSIRLNANDPSACTALSNGHILGTDRRRLFNGV